MAIETNKVPERENEVPLEHPVIEESVQSLGRALSVLKKEQQERAAQRKASSSEQVLFKYLKRFFGVPDTEQMADERQLPERNSREERMSFEYERKLAQENPERVGVVIDQRMLPDPRKHWSVDRQIAYLREQGKEPTGEELKTAREKAIEREEEYQKELENMQEYLRSLLGSAEDPRRLSHVRIHPSGDTSPVCVANAIDEKGEVVIDDNFLTALTFIAKNCPDTTLVIPCFNHRKYGEHEADLPSEKTDMKQYQDICRKILGRCPSVQLELGIEPNIYRGTDDLFAKRRQHPSQYIKPDTYGHFYATVASRMKQEFPNAKIAIAGLACFDPSYLEGVLETVAAYEQGGERTLIDAIGFHPYRKAPEDGSPKVTPEGLKPSTINFKLQAEEMVAIMNRFYPHATKCISEINFNFDEPAQPENLRLALEDLPESFAYSLIYPAVGVEGSKTSR